MRSLVLFVATLVVAGAVSSGPATAQDGPSDLLVTRARAKYGWSPRDAGPRHSLKLKATVLRPGVLAGLGVETTVDVMLGDRSVFSVEPATEGARVRMRGKRRWVARVKGTAGQAGTRRLKVDLRRGTLVLKVRKADLTALREGGRADLPLTLGVGQRTAGTNVTFRVRAGASPECWDLLRSGGTGGGGGGGGGGGDPGGGTDRELSMRNLASGMHTGIVGRSQRVVRTQTEWVQLWAQHDWPGHTPPAVDFSRDMVVAVFRGTPSALTGPNSYTGVAVSCVQSNGSRVLVTWEEVPNIPISCSPTSFAPCVGPSAYDFVAVERSTLSVQFSSAAPGTGCR